MNLKEELLLEHSKENSIRIANYLLTEQLKVPELIEIFLSNDNTLAKRSGMVISHLHDHYPKLFTKAIKNRIIEDFITKNQEVSVKRNSVRIIQDMGIPENFHSPLFNKCMVLLRSEEEAIAVRVFSMQVLYNLCEIYPELKSELIISLEDILSHNKGAGIKSRGNKILKSLVKL